MITHALQHCRGIGPFRLAKLHAAGVRSWNDVLDYSERIPATWRGEVVEESRRCLAALGAEDIQYFVDRLAPGDQWRILAHFFDQATFFDIETLGLHYDAAISVVVCWKAGQFQVFVEHENLDDFLGLIDHSELLVSFNGNSFDVPRLLNAFHIPILSCAHLDLRWPCYHQGFSGGLKEIARAIGIERPSDLRDVNGELAVALWRNYREHNDFAAREHLIRYCAADVLLLVMIACRLAGRDTWLPEDLWSTLPAISSCPGRRRHKHSFKRIVDASCGVGVPKRIQSLRRKRAR